MDTVKFGEHLIFDGYGCNPDKLGDMELCFDALNKIVELAKMTKFHEPYVLKTAGNETLGGKDPGGFSGFVMIHESHITIHTFTRRGFITVDLYSCSQFDEKGVVKYLKKTFEPKDENILKIERGMKYPAENIY